MEETLHQPQVLITSKKLKQKMKEIGVGEIGSVVGRYYAMDRDKRWERTKLAYDMLTLGKGEKIVDPYEAVLSDYKKEKTDEFIEPKVVISEKGRPLGLIQDGDGIFFFNFRADRARQLTMSLFKDDFKEFERKRVPRILEMATMTQYEKDFPLAVAFPPETLKKHPGRSVLQYGTYSTSDCRNRKICPCYLFFLMEVGKNHLKEKTGSSSHLQKKLPHMTKSLR